MAVKAELKGEFSWNGYHYGYRKLKSGNKYYKSKNVRFDDTCGGTSECTQEEYQENVSKYIEIFGPIED